MDQPPLPLRRHDDAKRATLGWPLRIAVVVGSCAALFSLLASVSLMRLADDIEHFEHDLADIAMITASLDNTALFAQRYGASGGANQDDRRSAEQAWSEGERARSMLFLRSGDDENLRPMMTTLTQAFGSERLAVDHIWSALDSGDSGLASQSALGPDVVSALLTAQTALGWIEHERADDLRSARQVERNWLFGLLAMFTSGVLIAAGSAWLTWKQAASSALRSAAYQQRLRKLAFRDPLTHLANRRLLEESFARAREFADRTGEGLFLFVIDLDRFKQINDSFGHHAGDHVLVEVARRLRTVCGDFDTVARSGGDEFIVLMQNSGRAGEPGMVSSLRSAVNRPTEYNGACIDISASIGVARYPHDGSTLALLTEYADRHMYHDKATSRDHVSGFSKLEASLLER